MERYSIKDLDKLSGIKAHTIRVWERRFKIVKPERTETNRRRYGDADLRRIINISILRKNGFKISEIARFPDSEIETKVSFLTRDVFHSDIQIDSLVIAMVDLNEKAINDLLARSMMNKGIEATMIELVFPFLTRIGVMWQTGSIDVGTEHFITNIFRQKLIESIDVLPPGSRKDGKRLLLFLPENELHEIGLLFYHYIARKAGHASLYLGQSTPLSSVVSINKHWNADIIITGVMSGFAGLKTDDYIKLLASSFPEQNILVAGELAKVAVRMNNKNVFILKSVEDLRAFL